MSGDGAEARAGDGPGSDGLLLRGRYVLASAAPDAALIADGAVAVEGGRVAAVGPYEEIAASRPGARELGSSRHLVMPGLVNSHHHGWGLTPFQLGAPDERLEPWMIDLFAARPVDPYLDALHSAIRLVRSGVTTVQHAGLPREPARVAAETRAALRAYERIGLRVAYGVPFQDRNTFAYQDDSEFLASLPRDLAATVRSAAQGVEPPGFEEFRDVVDELAERYREHPRIEVLLCPQGPEWCTDAALTEIRELANARGMLIHTHCLESPHQRVYMRREKGRPIVEWLDEIGFLGPDVSLAHAVWMERREIELCADRGVSLCHNPSSNIRLQVGVLPLRAILDAGVNVALGMDSTTLGEDDDMLQEMRLAAKLHGLPSGLRIAPAPDAAEVLRMSTLNGARALGLGDEVGALEPGRRADATLVDLDAVCAPYVDAGLDPRAILLQRARREHVDVVIVEGEVILESGEPTRVDPDEVAAELAESASSAIDPTTQAWIEALRAIKPHVARFYDGWEEPELHPTYVVNSPD